MRHFLAGSPYMVDWLWTRCPFSTHPGIHPLCNVALQLLSMRGRVPTSWIWASLVVYGQQNEVEGILCQFSRPHPQEACVFLCSTSCSSTSAMRAGPGSPAGWKVMNRTASAQLLQVMLHIYESKNKNSKPCSRPATNKPRSPESPWGMCEQKHVLLYVTKVLYLFVTWHVCGNS